MTSEMLTGIETVHQSAVGCLQSVERLKHIESEMEAFKVLNFFADRLLALRESAESRPVRRAFAAACGRKVAVYFLKERTEYHAFHEAVFGESRNVLQWVQRTIDAGETGVFEFAHGLSFQAESLVGAPVHQLVGVLLDEVIDGEFFARAETELQGEFARAKQIATDQKQERSG